MLRSKTVNTIRDLAQQGLSIRGIVDETGIARNTVRKYLRHATRSDGSSDGSPVPRKKRSSKLDPYKDQILRWIQEDHLFNCETMLMRLKERGYTGEGSILRDFVKPHRPARKGRYPVIRYETGPGEQMQIDWGEFVYDDDGKRRRLYGFTAVLSYSRMRFVCFFKRCDTASLIRGLMQALEYFGGMPQIVLTDRMKSVLVQVEDGRPVWNTRYADFMAALGMIPRVCRPYPPQTKGKVERSILVVKTSFWPGVTFGDLDALKREAIRWSNHRNAKVHRTTGMRPVERIREEPLAALPAGYAWERFRCEERKVSWDGYVSYDGVNYGLPSEPPLAGGFVSISATAREISIWTDGRHITSHRIRPTSGSIITHPDQFKNIPPAHENRHSPAGLGHLCGASPIVRRPLGDYDAIFRVQEEVAA